MSKMLKLAVEYKKRIEELEKENEELKRENEELSEELREIHEAADAYYDIFEEDEGDE